jgi:hypothetical protein
VDIGVRRDVDYGRQEFASIARDGHPACMGDYSDPDVFLDALTAAEALIRRSQRSRETERRIWEIERRDDRKDHPGSDDAADAAPALNGLDSSEI